MVIKVKTSFFEVLKNTKEALNLEQLNECYIEEWFDSFPYIVGDLSDSKLRLKQFNENKDSKDYFHRIPDYLLESCCYKPAYFILHKITEEEYESRKEEKSNDDITSGDTECFKMEKVPYDKENLVLEKTEKNRPMIRIDIAKETAVKIYPLPDDIVKEIQKEKQIEQRNARQARQNKPQNRQQNNSNNNQTSRNQQGNKNFSNQNNQNNQNNKNQGNQNNQINKNQNNQNNQANRNNPNNKGYQKNWQKDKVKNGEQR